MVAALRKRITGRVEGSRVGLRADKKKKEAFSFITFDLGRVRTRERHARIYYNVKSPKF